MFLLLCCIFSYLIRAVKIQAAVCDGHTTGHPCCAVHDCKEPLLTLRQRFCATHTYLNNICAVTDCQSPIETEHLTCRSPDHRALENAYFKQGKALSRLRKRLNNTPGHSQGKDSVEGEDDTGMLVESTPSCDGKPEAGNRKLKAFFGRRRTHNEQIIMRSCGVILSRATFFGSEAVSAVDVSLQLCMCLVTQL